MNDVPLPEGASEVRFWTDANIEYAMDLSFVTSCARTESFLKGAGVTDSLGSSKLTSGAMLAQVADKHGWDVDRQMLFAHTDVGGDSRYREVAIQELSGTVCRVFYVTGTV